MKEFEIKHDNNKTIKEKPESTLTEPVIDTLVRIWI
jgi:hypothetical protein